MNMPNAQQSREQKLIKKLTDQLRLMANNRAVIGFNEKVREDFPELPQDWHSLSTHLVKGGGDRHIQVAQFLTSVQSAPLHKADEQAIKNLLAYLLQTLVRKCSNDGDQGLSHIAVELEMTVELIINSRVAAPHLPSHDKDKQEHRNGQRNPQFEITGHYLPETGEWDAKKICQAIARDILKTIDDEQYANYLDPLKELVDTLSGFKDDYSNAPIQGVYLKKDCGYHPFQVDEVANVFYQNLGDSLWIYVYGGQESDNWLHTTEGGLKGLLKRYNNMIKPEPQKTTEDQNMGSKSFHVGDNSVVNIVTGQQSDNQIGHGNIKGIDTRQLLDLIGQLKTAAYNADDVSKPQYAAITQAADNIETEVQKPNGAGKSVLAQATKVLDSFKDIAGIAENINEITQILLPLIS